MRIGSQRGLFTLQRKVQVGVTEALEPNWVWQDWRPDVFVEVTVKRGKEWFDPNGNKRLSEDVWQFRTRYDEVFGIDAAMQIVHENNVYDIKAILPDGQFHRDCVIEATLQDGVLGGRPLSAAITSTIVKGIVGEAYAGLQIEASGGVEPYSFIAESGSLPPGLTLSASGLISGTPTLVGSFSVSVDVVDGNDNIDTLPAFNLVIEEAD